MESQTIENGVKEDVIVAQTEEKDTNSEPTIIENSRDNAEMPVLLLVPEESPNISRSTPPSPRPLSNDSGVSTPASDADLITANPTNIPSSVITHSSDLSPIVSSSSSDINAMNTTISISPPLPQQPAKRRPGRPPGSTKKYRQAAAMSGSPCGAHSPVFRRGTDFTLRKFFEAGGRDYNEYLEWLKRRDNGENV